jgi:hypothetical protein
MCRWYEEGKQGGRGKVGTTHALQVSDGQARLFVQPHFPREKRGTRQPPHFELSPYVNAGRLLKRQLHVLDTPLENLLELPPGR